MNIQCVVNQSANIMKCTLVLIAGATSLLYSAESLQVFSCGYEWRRILCLRKYMLSLCNVSKFSRHARRAQAENQKGVCKHVGPSPCWRKNPRWTKFLFDQQDLVYLNFRLIFFFVADCNIIKYIFNFLFFSSCFFGSISWINILF